jgi:hypothetical protein
MVATGLTNKVAFWYPSAATIYPVMRLIGQVGAFLGRADRTAVATREHVRLQRHCHYASVPPGYTCRAAGRISQSS